MNKEDFLLLYKKYLDGVCSAEELELLNTYRDDMILQDNHWLEELGDKDAISSRIQARLQENIKPVIPIKRRSYGLLKMAAAVLLLISIGLIFLKRPLPNAAAPIAKTKTPTIPAGSNKAFLTLSNGSMVFLNGKTDSILASQYGVQLSKSKDGLVIYKAGNANVPRADTIFNTITTPRGGQYTVILADGTKVLLNAASSLKYPVAFAGTTRTVELTGEAYFEVAKNKHMPFIVQANGAAVKVLGTHFNVSAYKNDETVTATLLEGSVQFSKGSSSAMLVPGQQGTVSNKDNSLTVKTADMEETMSWKNGFFIFHDEGIANIMKKVSRWYDVDIEYRGNVEGRQFGGAVSRYKDITELLNNMKLTGAINYRLEERRVIIMN